MGKMLVWAEKKIYEAGNKNKLLGYRIEVVGSDNAGDIGAKTEVTKEALKRAATLGQIEVVNLTLTSNGIFVGKATKRKPGDLEAYQEQREQQAQGGYSQPIFNQDDNYVEPKSKIIEIYTNGKRISSAMIDTTQLIDCGLAQDYEINGLNHGISFDIGLDVVSNIKNEIYSNVKMENKKIVGQFRKKPFKAVKNKFLNILNNYGDYPKILVNKANAPGEYVIYTETPINNVTINNIILCLINDTLYSESIMPMYVKNNKFYVKCATGINDVRKAMKLVFVAEQSNTKNKSGKK